MSFGTGVIMLGSAEGAPSAQEPDDVLVARRGIYIAVEDADAHCERAKAAGAEITRELEDTDYGSREYSARDPDGYHWSFGTYRLGTSQATALALRRRPRNVGHTFVTAEAHPHARFRRTAAL